MRLLMTTILLGGLVALVAVLATPAGPAANVTPDPCAPLAAPTGRVIHVDPSQVGQLREIVRDAETGDTIMLADGAYALHGDYLWFDTPGVTLRGASGDREAVILDGHYESSEIITIIADDVTIADLSIRRARTHPIHVSTSGDADVHGTLIYNVHLVDPGQQAVKINQNGNTYPDDGVVACSHIELSDAGRPWVWDINGSCYTGGIDGHQVQGWVVRDNLINGFWCPQGLSEHGVHFWTGSRDTIVERNVLLDNARGVGFGLGSDDGGRTYPDDPCPGVDHAGHFGGVVRNNFILAGRAELFASQAGFDCGVCLAQACGTGVLHNTVYSSQAPFSSIEWRFDDTDAHILNNLVSHNLRDRGGAARLDGNLSGATAGMFVDAAAGDLHLVAGASAAIDQGVDLAAGLCDDDIDGDARPLGGARDVGADEYGAPPPAAVNDLRVRHVVTSTTKMTVTLGWTGPSGAVSGAMSYTLRYAEAPLDAENWAGAQPIPVPFAATPGAAETLTAALPCTGGTNQPTLYFALTTHDTAGRTSTLSNNAFWPRQDLFIPLVHRRNAHLLIR